MRFSSAGRRWLCRFAARRGRPPKAASARVVRSTTTKPTISSPGAASKRIAELERKIGQQQVELDFFGKPCGRSGSTPSERRSWRDAVYAVIQTMTTSLPQGELTIERMRNWGQS